MTIIRYCCDDIYILDLNRGDELKIADNIEDAISIGLAFNGKLEIGHYKEKIENASQLLSYLDKIKRNVASTGRVPLIVLTGHANKDHLQLPNREHIHWKDVFALLSEINELTRNNLAVLSSSCWSAFALKHSVKLGSRAPVYSLIAPEVAIEAGSVADGFGNFIRELLRSEDLQKAIQAFDDTEAVNPKHYALHFCGMLFRKAIYQTIKGIINTDYENLYQAAIIQEPALANFSKQTMIDGLIELNQHKFYPVYDRYYRHYMMLDLFSENEERDAFDVKAFEEEVRAGKIVIE
ncbi:hypothetical protein [Pseudoalteromonas ardens]|uniref:Uncharacterized protein n=1 Tax=Pseudoalteromonas rubra TaxID=43658 RepID=A0A0L0ETW5_9GAMM|nr:hypothetical protein [Pseudoalteromonas sp. R96]KNC67854.1 hypothetical protein AC626_08205 [Pseudoalteromonas rubra]MDK1311241.1 hypothetical protein [Pseudoalteromonas sp. R96]